MCQSNVVGMCACFSCYLWLYGYGGVSHKGLYTTRKWRRGAYKPLESMYVLLRLECVILVDDMSKTNFFGGASWQ